VPQRSAGRFRKPSHCKGLSKVAGGPRKDLHSHHVGVVAAPVRVAPSTVDPKSETSPAQYVLNPKGKPAGRASSPAPSSGGHRGSLAATGPSRRPHGDRRDTLPRATGDRGPAREASRGDRARRCPRPPRCPRGAPDRASGSWHRSRGGRMSTAKMAPGAGFNVPRTPVSPHAAEAFQRAEKAPSAFAAALLPEMKPRRPLPRRL
jgi:hypothetical protein